MQIQECKINEPCVVDVIVDKNQASITWSVGNGTDEIKVDLNKDDISTLKFEFGDTSNIKYGGTDNWGKDLLPIYINYEEGSEESDSIFVDDITIQEYAGENDWCRCYKLSDGALMYQALTENPSNEPRVAYFKHSTTDTELKRGFYQGRPAASEWYVTVIQEPNPNGSEKEIFDLEKLIGIFNEILETNGNGKISEEETPITYNYLSNVYDLCVQEWENPDSKLFKEETYPEVYDYHGENTKYHDLAFVSMKAWLLAMCLSEIVPTSGEYTNTQTQLFQKAYELGGGRNIPLFDDYEIHSDVMIARLAAGVIYASNRGKYTFDDIEKMRYELAGDFIYASDWEGLGYTSPDNRSIGYLGFLVNSEEIFPSAPGPYSNDTDPDRPKPFEEGQDEDLFYMDEEDWKKYNYKMDVEIDNYITSNYNFGSETYNTPDGWENQDREKRILLLHTAIMPAAYDRYFFGSRRIKFVGVHDSIDDQGDTFNKYEFVETDEDLSEDVYDIVGPFADFESKMFNPDGEFGTNTSAMDFFQKVMDIADNSRYPSYHTEYGRRRPLGGETRGTTRHPLNGHPLNGILNCSACAIFADDQDQYDKCKIGDDFPHDAPRSYPSGHAAMTWTDALMLVQMFGDIDRTIKYVSEAYKVGVGRNIGRYHWTSDAIYGRLFATFTLPIINAMSGLQDEYNVAKNIITNDKEINIEICNNTDNPISLIKKISIILANPDQNGNYIGWNGCYNRYYLLNDPSTVLDIEPHSSITITGIPIDNIDTVDCPRNFIDIDLQHENTPYVQQSNVLLYDLNGESENIISRGFDSSVTIESGRTYVINID